MEFKSPRLPEVYLRFSQQIVHMLAMPVFFFLFMILYRPFGLIDLLKFTQAGFAFNTAIMTAIVFVVMLISRFILWGLRGKELTRRDYLLWCVAEIAVSSLFVTMYLTLMSRGTHNYIDIFPMVVAELSAILIFPYITLWLLLESDFVLKFSNREDDVSNLRFYDNRHKLKFVTKPSAVLYVQVDENYCTIYYTEGQKIKTFMMRSTMKNMVDICAPRGIIRCHRSYCINVSHIKVLRKEKEGLNVAELDVEGAGEIPVTTRYYEQVALLL